MNYYMRLKTPIEETLPIEDVLREGLEAKNPKMPVELIDRQTVHIAKCTWGWTPSFQATPSYMPFEEQVRANDIYSIESLSDIRGYLNTGKYEIVNEDGCVISQRDFEKIVVGWENHMRSSGYEGEIRDHTSKGRDALQAYRDPLGYQFCKTCFC